MDISGSCSCWVIGHVATEWPPSMWGIWLNLTDVSCTTHVCTGLGWTPVAAVHLLEAELLVWVGSVIGSYTLPILHQAGSTSLSWLLTELRNSVNSSQAADYSNSCW